MPGETGIKLDLTEFNAKLEEFVRISSGEAATFTAQVGEAILSRAQKRTPVLTGFLQNSSLRVEVNGSKGLAHEIGFTAKYAAAVHERPELTHKQGQAFYLKAAIDEDGPGIMQRAVPLMAQRIAGRLGS